MAQTGNAVNQINRNQHEIAQQIQQSQATQGAIAQAATGQNQQIAQALQQIGQHTVANTQLVAMAGNRLQQNQELMANAILRTLREMAAEPRVIINQQAVTQTLNQYGFANPPQAVVNAVMQARRGRITPHQLAWHMAALPPGPEGQEAAQHQAALPAPQAPLQLVDIAGAPMAMDAAGAAPMPVVGPQGNMLALQIGQLALEPPPVAPEPVPPLAGTRKRPLKYRKFLPGSELE